MANTKRQRRQIIRYRIRSKVKGTAQRPRLSVFRSNKGIYAQLIDDISGKTLASASSVELKSGKKLEQAKEVGKKLGELAKAAKIENAVFDRGGYLYHGRVKALAEGAREAGLKI